MEGECMVCRRTEQPITSCHRCGKAYCEECSQHVWLYSVEETKVSTNVCTQCSSRIHAIESLIDRENLVWGRLSPIGQRWFTASLAQQLSTESKDTLNTYSTLPIEPADKEMIQKDVFFGRTDPETFNWEYTELIHRVVERAGPVEAYRGSIARVLEAYCGRNSTIGYCQGLNFVAAWLLLFMDENSAFWMLTKLVSSTLLPGFYSGAKTGNSLNGFYIEAGVIAKLIESDQQIKEASGISMSDFADFFCIQLLIQLFVGTVDVPTAVFLWDRLSAEGVIGM